MKTRRFLILFLVVTLSCGILAAQTQLSITSMVPVLRGNNKFINVLFSQGLDAAFSGDLSATGVAVVALPSGTSLTIVGIERRFGNPKELRFTLSGSADPSDAQVRLTIEHPMHFREDTTAGMSDGPLSFTAPLIKDARTTQEAMQKLVEQMTKAEKPSQDKQIFASGFVTTASGGETEGGADISLNSLDLGIPGLKTFANIKKTSEDGSDPKNFEAGGTFRSTFLWSKMERTQLQAALTALNSATPEQRPAAALRYNNAVRAFQKATIGAMYLDFAGKLEGQATNFNITNGVLEASFKVQSRVKKLFGETGFYHFQVLFPGFEGGQTLREPDEGAPATATDMALQQLDGIVRLKAGLTVTAYWENPSPYGPLRRAELELGGVDRYLFLDEIRYDTATKTNNIAKSGNTYYYHVDLKLFVAESGAGRYGFKINYNRGKLPPVYAPVNSFQFGFLFETRE
jgi:hypothetical protein